MRLYEAADAARYYAPDNLSEAEYERLTAASREAWAAVEATWSDDDPFNDGRRKLAGVFSALTYVGRHRDRYGLAQAAAGALSPYGSREHGRTWASDSIRGRGGRRRPVFDNAPTEGPDTPTATAARASAQTLARASRIPFKGDEEWMECAELIGEAYLLARAAADQ